MLLVLTAAMPQDVIAQSDMVDGQVTKIDASAGKITIRHGPLKKFDMDDGMTMVFKGSGSRDAQEGQARR